MPSSVIAAMHYNEQQRRLTIVFRGGRGRYHYFDVPREEWESFRAAPSKGTYLNERFKLAGYRFEKVSGRAGVSEAGADQSWPGGKEEG